MTRWSSFPTRTCSPSSRRAARRWSARELATAPPVAALVPLDSVSLLAPLPRPASIRDCMSFEKHVINSTRAIGLGPYARVDRAVERLLGRRFSLAHRVNRTFFQQPPYYKSNPRTVVGPDADVRIPAYSEQFDYELEWGVVIGKQGVDIRAERAREHIAGYTIFNDFRRVTPRSARWGGTWAPPRARTSTRAMRSGPGS
jgi:hypothetical protein